MTEILFSKVTPNELVNLISESLTTQLKEVFTSIELNPNSSNKPHLTRRETAQFFDVSLNCLNDWSKKGILKPFKVGQRVYYSRQECINVLFNQTNND